MPQASTPVYASFPSERLTIGAGVAIFHLASARVVVCYHTRDKYCPPLPPLQFWMPAMFEIPFKSSHLVMRHTLTYSPETFRFLPKGRKNANEPTTTAAEREGFEESGYRNRIIPLPFQHRATDPDHGHERFVTEPLWLQFLPLSARSQYILFWYAAETLPAEIEDSYSVHGTQANTTTSSRTYQPPPAFPNDLSLTQRIAQDTTGKEGESVIYEPTHHPNTGVDEEELLYESYLLPIADARHRLRSSVMEDVVRRGWEAVQLRIQMEMEDDI